MFPTRGSVFESYGAPVAVIEWPGLSGTGEIHQAPWGGNISN